jgi:hypothetical protein
MYIISYSKAKGIIALGKYLPKNKTSYITKLLSYLKNINLL